MRACWLRGPPGAGAAGTRTTVNALPGRPDSELIGLVTAELGGLAAVGGTCSTQKAVVFDDPWASAREDLVKLWLTDGRHRRRLARLAGASRCRPRRGDQSYLVANEVAGAGP